MKKVSLNPVEIDLKFEKYRDTKYFYFKIESKSDFVKNLSGFTNENGIKKLKKGETDITYFYFKLLTKEQINNFRILHFTDALAKIETKDYFEYLNNPEYELIEIVGASHNIKNINGNFLPKCISFSLYEISNEDFNLNETLKKLGDMKGFEFRTEKERYDKDIVSEYKGLTITKIPYYNADDGKTQKIDLIWSPTTKQWDDMMEIFFANKQVDVSGYISDLNRKIIELGIIGGITNGKKIYTKNFKKAI